METTGVKYDKAKPRWSLLPEGVLKDVIEVLELGAKKYSDNNWMKVEGATVRYYDAMMRHIQAWWEGEGADPETGKSHLAHAVCCALFLMWFDKQREKTK